MKLAIGLSWVLLLPCLAEKGHPIAKVMALLEGLQQKVATEAADEHQTFVVFTKWCSESKTTFAEALAKENTVIASAKSKVSSSKMGIEAAESNIKSLDAQISKYTGEGIEAANVHKQAGKDYQQSNSDLADTIKMVQNVLKTLNDSVSTKLALTSFLKPSKSAQQTMLVKLMEQPLVLAELTEGQQEALTAAAFADQPKVSADDILKKSTLAKTRGASGKAGYAATSGSLVQMIQGLLKGFEDKKRRGTKASTYETSEYEKTDLARKEALAAAEKALETQKMTKEDETGKNAEALEEQKNMETMKEDDTKALAACKTRCALKTSENKERMETRRKEIQSMKTAVQIMAKVSGVRAPGHENAHKTIDRKKAREEAAAKKDQKTPKKVADDAVEETPELPEMPIAETPETPIAEMPSMLIQEVNDPKTNAVNLIKTEAMLTHSAELSAFADTLALKLNGPFDAIGSSVQKMIWKLRDEQKKENEHKDWCDIELANTDFSNTTKQTKLEELVLKMDVASADISKLGSDIEEMEGEIVTRKKESQEDVEVRAKQKADNALTVKDASGAADAIAMAVAELTKFYKESGAVTKEAWELMQVHKGPAPEATEIDAQPKITEGAYSSAGGDSPTDGILKLLEETGAEYSTMKANTKASEVQSEREFKDEAIATKKLLAANANQVELWTQKKQRVAAKLNSMTRAKRHLVSDLHSVEQYHADLTPACISGDSSFDDRKKNRDGEIQSLKDAKVKLKNAFNKKTTTIDEPQPSFLQQ